MNGTLARKVLYALIVCSLASGSVYAAETRASGGEAGKAGDAVHQRREPALAAGNAKGDALRRDEPTKSIETAIRDSHPQNSAGPNGQRAAALHGAGLIRQRGVGPLQGTHADLSRPAVAAARANLLRGPDADHPASRSAPMTGAARAFSTTTVPAGAGRPYSAAALSVAGQLPASLKALGRNGVIGGPRAAGSGSVGGPANSKTVIKASIDGSWLHRRF